MKPAHGRCFFPTTRAHKQCLSPPPRHREIYSLMLLSTFAAKLIANQNQVYSNAKYVVHAVQCHVEPFPYIFWWYSFQMSLTMRILQSCKVTPIVSTSRSRSSRYGMSNLLDAVNFQYPDVKSMSSYRMLWPPQSLNPPLDICHLHDPVTYSGISCL